MKFLTFVNEEKGIVTVKAEDALSEYWREFVDLCRRYDVYSYDLWAKFEDKFGKQIQDMRGFSTCNVAAGEKFDFEVGFMIAKERYLKNFETYRIHMYEMIQDKFDEIAETARLRKLSCMQRSVVREERLDSLIHHG